MRSGERPEGEIEGKNRAAPLSSDLSPFQDSKGRVNQPIFDPWGGTGLRSAEAEEGSDGLFRFPAFCGILRAGPRFGA